MPNGDSVSVGGIYIEGVDSSRDIGIPASTCSRSSRLICLPSNTTRPAVPRPGRAGTYVVGTAVPPPLPPDRALQIMRPTSSRTSSSRMSGCSRRLERRFRSKSCIGVG